MTTTNLVSEVTITSSIAANPIPPTPFIPDSGNLFPKWPSQLDVDSWDEWQFQALSADGSIALVVVFFRHTINAPAGFRVGINASWAGSNNNGEEKEEAVWCGPVMLPCSTITSDTAHTTGVWRTENGSESISFEISTDLSGALVTLNVPGKVTGTLTLTSHNFHSLPQTEAEAKGSVFWWLRPIAMAGVDADLTFFSQQKGTIEKGMGGYERDGRELKLRAEEGAFGTFERAWAVSPPHKTISHNWILWGKAGGYLIQVIWMMGRPAEEGVLSGSGRLYHDGELVCQTERAVAAAEGEGEAFTLEYIHGDGITGAFRPKNVGHRIVFEAGEKRWEFEFCHERLWYEMPLGPPRPDVTGLSGFVVSVSGGLVGSAEKVQGPGMVGGGIMP
ncbi:uncharacterized protein BP5553_10293 [Venustampulla echinocandica]|uniref:AttH domain-containing protein n=1 Tax=Venustampulla echinocandica TaxID=2656787 RepID=A0A370T9U4_9HELO|nr:uncharacterized protein BP5553_10293 [Venustampulla echinocandica]RDL30415.1 hypothetical protein BP5553_10293 [Venustampulla echinocandica]